MLASSEVSTDMFDAIVLLVKAFRIMIFEVYIFALSTPRVDTFAVSVLDIKALRVVTLADKALNIDTFPVSVLELNELLMTIFDESADKTETFPIIVFEFMMLDEYAFIPPDKKTRPGLAVNDPATIRFPLTVNFASVVTDVPIPTFDKTYISFMEFIH